MLICLTSNCDIFCHTTENCINFETVVTVFLRHGCFFVNILTNVSELWYNSTQLLSSLLIIYYFFTILEEYEKRNMKKRKTVMRSVARAGNAWFNMLKQVALDEGVPDSYRQVIMFLHRNPGAVQRSIAEFEGITASAVNQTVKNMLEEDYLYKETAVSDKRSSKLYLTEKGNSVAVRLLEKIECADDAVTAHIGEEKEAEMIELLDTLTAFIQEVLGEC